MKLTHTFTLDQKTFRVYVPENAASDTPLVLTFLQPHEADALAALLSDGLMLLALDEADWERSFTPWPAPRVFKKAADFSGGAANYLVWLTDALSDIEGRLNLRPQWRGIAGYSLAGLFAAWCAYRESPFGRTACVSGSLWFDGWTDFAAVNAMPKPPQRAYFSIGDTEKNSKNPRMAAVEDHMRFTENLWRGRGIQTAFALNSGSHFHQVPERLADAVSYLAEAV